MIMFFIIIIIIHLFPADMKKVKMGLDKSVYMAQHQYNH